MTTRILTWNLQGRAGPDLDEVAAVIDEARPDLVALQEVQRGQATALAERLGMVVEWRFKHWPLVVPAEGLAVLTPFPVRAIRTKRLAGGPAFWAWRRRIAIAVTIDGPSGPITVVDTHLGAGVGDGERLRQAQIVADLVGTGTGVICGDLNAHPGSIVLGALAGEGFRDAWHDVHPQRPGPTNWPPGPRTEAPSQRLDYVLMSPGLWAVAAELPTHGDPGFERFGRLSDHLPLVVSLDATD